jgi:hypothetical protein
MMYESINGSRRRHGVPEDTLPFREREVAGDHQTTPLITFCQ